MKIAYLTLATIAASLALQSCGADGDHPGYEYMPNMYRSASYETYSENPFFENGITSQTPVKGTIPRGFMPFEYENSLEDYLRAGNELNNPLELNSEILKRESNCMRCFVNIVMEKKVMEKAQFLIHYIAVSHLILTNCSSKNRSFNE